MHFSALAAALAGMAAFSSARPAVDAADGLPRFYLQSEVVDGPAKYNGLYVAAYHTAAGEAAASMTTKPYEKSYINDTVLYFAYGGTSPDYQYPVQLVETDPSNGWGYVTINIISKGARGFYLDGASHLHVKDLQTGRYGFAAPWKVCTWNHGVPELFWNNPNAFDYDAAKFRLPDCADVRLKAVPA